MAPTKVLDGSGKFPSAFFISLFETCLPKKVVSEPSYFSIEIIFGGADIFYNLDM